MRLQLHTEFPGCDHEQVISCHVQALVGGRKNYIQVIEDDHLTPAVNIEHPLGDFFGDLGEIEQSVLIRAVISAVVRFI